VVQGRPNWWVILAVSLALMALLVATSGSSPHPVRRGGALASARAGGPRRGDAAPGQAGSTRVQAGATTTSVPHPAPVTPTTSGPSLVSTGPPAGAPPDTGPATTTTTVAATTTTTTTSPAASQPADRMQTQGYLDPPLQTSNGYGFTGTGAMQIAVLWSGTTYLTMSISCPGGNQNVGGTSAMEASLPDATGSCRATVSEPSSESAALTYTITIGPAGG